MRPGARRFVILLGAGASLFLRAGGLAAGTPLHVEIDRAIEAGLEGRAADPATDAEFLRRVHLDLTGVIPTPAEARAFLDDPSPYKRERRIDRLLESPGYARRMQEVFDVMWMERRPDLHVPAPPWREYLRRSFAENKPYDRLVAEILSADGLDPSARAPAKFLLDREADPNLLTRDVGRLFLGVDLQCAQCHDHPLIDGYKQAHYYGLYAFLGRSFVFTDPGTKVAALAEKAEGDVTFKSVFKRKVTHRTGPRILDAPPVAEPTLAEGREYLVPPDKDNKVRPVPAFSRRARLAPLLASAETPEFGRNIANRLWALMMRRGLVHPLDLHHGENPPSHPELLDLLSRELAASGFDVKHFLRELALSRAYQRSSEPPPGASADLEDPSRFAVAALRPLSPEQLAWSVMQATGRLPAARRAAEARLEGADPKLRDILRSDDARRRLREGLLESAAFDSLAGDLAPFLAQFGGVAGQAQDGDDTTVHQALFLTNGHPIQGWLAPSGENLTARLAALADPSAVAEELYLAILTRRPTDEERAEVARHLDGPADRRAGAIGELAWALLASTEFRFQH